MEATHNRLREHKAAQPTHRVNMDMPGKARKMVMSTSIDALTNENKFDNRSAAPSNNSAGELKFNTSCVLNNMKKNIALTDVIPRVR